MKLTNVVNKKETIMKLKIAALLLCIACPIQAAESDTDVSLSLLAIGKLTGLCGAMNQMARFQEATGLENGNVFAARFYISEAERLGQTPQEFSLECNDVTKKYSDLYRMFEEIKALEAK